MVPDAPWHLSLCPVGCLSSAFLNWDSQQGRDLATSGHNIQKFQLGQSCYYIMRKVWCHQIWIQNNLGFMVLYICKYVLVFLFCHFSIFHYFNSNLFERNEDCATVFLKWTDFNQNIFIFRHKQACLNEFFELELPTFYKSKCSIYL